MFLNKLLTDEGSRSAEPLSRKAVLASGASRAVPGTDGTASGFPPRADFDDTATYSAVATNVHGQVSTNAAVVVRSECALGVGGGCSRLLSPFSACRDRPAVLQGSGVTRSRSIRWGSRLDVS